MKKIVWSPKKLNRSELEGIAIRLCLMTMKSNRIKMTDDLEDQLKSVSDYIRKLGFSRIAANRFSLMRVQHLCGARCIAYLKRIGVIKIKKKK